MDFDWRHRRPGRNEFLNGGMSYNTMLCIYPFDGFYGQAGLIWRKHETETWESYRRSSRWIYQLWKWISSITWVQRSSSSHVWMWELDHKEDWGSKNWCFGTVVLKKILDSPLDCKEIKPVNPKGNQSWIFIERTDAEAEVPILWPPDVKSWLFRKDPDDGKDWRQEEKGTTEDKMLGWHHWLNRHEFEQAPGLGEGSLECCSPWGRSELDMTERLNKNNIKVFSSIKWGLSFLTHIIYRVILWQWVPGSPFFFFFFTIHWINTWINKWVNFRWDFFSSPSRTNGNVALTSGFKHDLVKDNPLSIISSCVPFLGGERKRERVPKTHEGWGLCDESNRKRKRCSTVFGHLSLIFWESPAPWIEKHLILIFYTRST